MMPGAPQRSEIVEMLATFGERRPDQVTEAISSLELAWLLHQIEQRYGEVDIDDDTIAAMTTVTGAVNALRRMGIGSPDD